MSCKKNTGPDEVPLSIVAGCDYLLDESDYTNRGWTKIFDDNFDKDLSKWDIWTGGAYNNELQFYQANNLELLNGVLQITARKETIKGVTLPTNPVISSFQYTSGRIESKTHFSANTLTPKLRMLARIKLPAGYGMWPAFWSYGDPWPTQGEIDMLEARGNEPRLYHTNYYYGNTAGNIIIEDASGTIQATTDLTDCFHVFEMEWSQNALSSYLDGKLVETKTSGTHIPDLFGKTERMVLNLSVGGGFFPGLDKSLIQTGVMQVDWVKVFASK